MPVGGYDPDDVDDALANRLEKRDVADYLTDEEVERWEAGESLSDLLTEEDIGRLLEADEDD